MIGLIFIIGLLLLVAAGFYYFLPAPFSWILAAVTILIALVVLIGAIDAGTFDSCSGRRC